MTEKTDMQALGERLRLLLSGDALLAKSDFARATIEQAIATLAARDAQAESGANKPTPQQISDYLNGLDRIERELVEHEARAAEPQAQGVPEEMSVDELALIREEAARITDDWAERQLMEPSRKEADAKFVSEILRIAAAHSREHVGETPECRKPSPSCDPADICAGCRCEYNTYAAAPPSLECGERQLSDERINAIADTYAKRWSSSGGWNVRRCVQNALIDVRALLSKGE